MTKTIKKLEKELPKLTGVYFFKNAANDIIYIGKAKNLHTRVNSYFQNYTTDWKIKSLIDEHTDIDYILTPTETESLLLEAQLIQKYKPKFNVLIKEGQPFIYILFSPHPSTSSQRRQGYVGQAGRAGGGKVEQINSIGLPQIELVRNKKKKGTYFGPFLQKTAARKTYNFLMHTFRLNLCNKKIENGCLDYHIGNCAGSCKAHFDAVDYHFRVQLASDALKNNQTEFIQKIKSQMVTYSAEFAFEKAQRLHEYLQNIDVIFSTLNMHFNENKFKTDIFVVSTPTPYTNDINPTINTDLQKFLGFSTPVRTVDCFDISHFQSSHLVGSCVRFTDGKPDKHMFRRFKIKTLIEQNDYAALQEIVQRRYKNKDDYPDLIVIDGGKGQLSAVQHVLPHAPLVSLAKREEILYGPQFPDGVHLDVHTSVGKLLIALRDYAHHFAISYHRLKRKNITS